VFTRCVIDYVGAVLFEDGRLLVVARRDKKRVIGLWFERGWGYGLLVA
jgi:hypothetical protein